MAWRIVKQPNGLLAMWSDMSDSFTYINMDEPTALDLCRVSWGEEVSVAKVKAGVEDHVPWTHGVKGSGHDRWDDCVRNMDAEALKAILEKMECGNALDPEE